MEVKPPRLRRVLALGGRRRSRRRPAGREEAENEHLTPLFPLSFFLSLFYSLSFTWVMAGRGRRWRPGSGVELCCRVERWPESVLSAPSAPAPTPETRQETNTEFDVYELFLVRMQKESTNRGGSKRGGIRWQLPP